MYQLGREGQASIFLANISTICGFRYFWLAQKILGYIQLDITGHPLFIFVKDKQLYRKVPGNT